MDAFASPSTRPEWSGRGRAHPLESVVMTLILGLSLMSLPRAPDARLDGSWQEMLIYAHAHGLQFGRDLIFTWGPWGFLCSRFQLGSLEAGPMILWQTGGQALLALGLVALIRDLPAGRRLFFAAAVLFTHWLFQDVIYFVLISLIGIAGLMRRPTTLLRLTVWALALGFLGQLKFTYFVIATAAVLAATGYWFGRGSRLRPLAIPGVFAVATMAAWAAAGQNLDNLYPYLRRSFEIASGYGDAMGFDEPLGVFLWGSAVAIACLIYCWSVWRAAPEKGLAFWGSGFLAFTFFVMWKEAYTRADLVSLGGHVFGFIILVLLMAPLVGGLFFDGRRWQPFDACVGLCLLAIGCIDAPYYALAPKVEWQRLYGNVEALRRGRQLPADWQRDLEDARAAANLPRIRAAVGAGTVDVYDFDTGIALLNQLHLDARPIFQGYSAYTPSLEGSNLRFYQSPRAPEFLLWDDGRVDGRYPAEDDAMLVVALPGHYTPLLTEGAYSLFRRLTPVGREPLEKRGLIKRSVPLFEEIDLPRHPAQALWLQADAVPNLLGRARALLYKPATLYLETKDYTGEERRWRLLPRVMKTGFLLVPTLWNGNDLAALMNGEATSGVKSFRFEAPPDQKEFWSHVETEIFELPSLPLRPLSIGLLVEQKIFDRRARSITSTEQQEIVDVVGTKALLLHAEGQLVFDLPPHTRGIRMSYGIRPEAYTGAGRTDGVEFSVEIASGEGREGLWRRYLDPVNEAKDRGPQMVDLIPKTEGSAELIIRTAAGPHHDNRWDWSYISSIRFDVPGER